MVTFFSRLLRVSRFIVLVFFKHVYALPDSLHLSSLEDVIDNKVGIFLGRKQAHYPSFISDAKCCLGLSELLDPDPH